MFPIIQNAIMNYLSVLVIVSTWGLAQYFLFSGPETWMPSCLMTAPDVWFKESPRTKCNHSLVNAKRGINTGKWSVCAVLCKASILGEMNLIKQIWSFVTGRALCSFEDWANNMAVSQWAFLVICSFHILKYCMSHKVWITPPSELIDRYFLS